MIFQIGNNLVSIAAIDSPFGVSPLGDDIQPTVVNHSPAGRRGGGEK